MYVISLVDSIDPGVGVVQRQETAGNVVAMLQVVERFEPQLMTGWAITIEYAP
jgi:hypothetical protein